MELEKMGSGKPNTNKMRVYEASIKKLFSKMTEFLNKNRRGNIIFPVKNSIFLLDILDYLSHKSKTFEKIHVISEAA